MKTIGFISFVAIAFGFSLRPNAVKLEYVFNLGDEYVMSQSTKQVLRQTIMGTEQKGENEYSGDMKLKIKELTGDGAKIEMQFIKLKSKSVTVLGEVLMDSEGDA